MSARAGTVGVTPAVTAALRGAGFRIVELGGDAPASLDEVAVVIAQRNDDPAALTASLRQRTQAPLIVITAAPPVEQLEALRYGADLVLQSAEDPQLVAGHAVALVRRVGHPQVAGIVTAGPVIVDARRRQVTIAGEELRLSPREFDLLLCLARTPGIAYRRDDLLDAVWGARFQGTPNTVDVHVSWLRQKLAVAADVRITTLRGFGYRLDILRGT